MTHALRQHCGSFLQDNLLREWGDKREDPLSSPSGSTKPLKDTTRMEEEDGRAIKVKCAPKQWPLFSAPGLSSMRVVGSREKGGTLYFTVMAILEGFKWKLDRTYEEFAELQRTLVRVYGMQCPPLPSPRKLFGIFGSVKPNHVEEMKASLEAFVMSAVTSFPVPPTELLKFVEYPFTDVLSVTQALARFFYDEGEIVLTNEKAVQMSPLQLHCINKRMTLPLASSETGKMKDDFGHLLDFFQNLKKLKIAPPTEEHASIADLDSMTFDLTLMKSLEVLLMESIKIHRLEARHTLPKQLVKLEVRRSLKFLQEILLVYPATDVEHSPVSPVATPLLFSSTQAVDTSRAMVWENLQQANFKLNGIKKIDESVKLLSALERLDLSFNYIEAVEHLVELPHLRVLDLSHNKITQLVDLHTKLGNITKLGLASNSIVKLNGIQKMFSIQYLDLANNQISDASEVKYLDPLPCLEKLYLKGNPVASSLSYRSQVFSHLPHHAEQVGLDGKLPTQDELMVSINTPTTSHKKILSRTPDIRPDEEILQKTEDLEELKVGIGGMTKGLEELRKEGGDKWLEILNAERNAGKDDESVVAKPSPKNPKKKKRHTHTHHKPTAKTKKLPETPPALEVTEGALSYGLTMMMKAAQEETIPIQANFNVTVLEYRNSSFLSLNAGDLDQLLQNTPMEECILSINTLVGKALEVDVTAGGSCKVERDLRLIHHMKLHEGKRLAVCLQLPSSKSAAHGSSRWILYSVHELSMLPKLYYTLKFSMTRSRSATPDHPNYDIIPNLSSESSSLTSSLTRPPPPLSDPNSQHLLTMSLPPSAFSAGTGAAATPPGSEGWGPDNQSTGRVKATSMSSAGGDLEDSSELDQQNSGSFTGITATSASRSAEQPITNGVTSPLTSSADYSSVTDSDVLSPLSSMSATVASEGSVKVIPAVVLEQEREQKEPSPSFQQTQERGKSEMAIPAPTDSQDSKSAKVTSPGSPRIGSRLTASLGKLIPGKTQGKSGSTPKSSEASTSKGLLGSGSNTPKLQAGSGSNTPAQQKGSGSNTPLQQGRSGSNTPKRQEDSESAMPPSQLSTGKGFSDAAASKSSKPPSSVPPHALSSDYFMKKLEGIVSPVDDATLPSPLYTRDDKTLAKAKKESVDGDGEVQGSIYDSAPPKDLAKSDAEMIEQAVHSTSSQLRRPRARELPAVREIINKPDLGDNNLRLFFKRVIADDSSEILMNITWGVSNLPSAPSCEIEVGTIISDRGIYLLEVLDPANHRARPLSWTSENFPLTKITCCYHSTLQKISVGIFDQSLTVESFEKGVAKRFVLFPHTYEKLNLFIENLKAAFDAYKLPYTICSSEKGFSSGKAKGMVIQNPGTLEMANLKENLVWSNSRAEVGKSLVVSSRSESGTTDVSFEANVRRLQKERTSKFEIVQYVIVGVLSSDFLPISNGKLHVQSRALILTNDTIYLCKEEIDSWPYERASIRTPPFPKCMVIDAHPITRISGIKVCDKSHPIVSCTDPLYEFSISFEELDDIQLSPTLSAEWILCVHDRQYLDQLLACLTHLANEQHKETHKVIGVKHTSNQFASPVSPKPPRQSQVDTGSSRSAKKGGVMSNRGTSPCFFSSRALFDFSVLTNYQRLKFFKKHVAQAEFMKSDEVPLSVFLAHCSSSRPEYVEVEACVIVSNYAMYLLSCVNNIQLWVDAGASTPFPRRELLDTKDPDKLKCFYRLWLNKIKVVEIGIFYNSVSVMDMDEHRFMIHTENPSSTLSFLTALSCVVSLHDTEQEKEMESILSGYELVDDDIDEQPARKPDATNEQHCVEFVYHSEDSITPLKRQMAVISPAIAKNLPRDISSGMLKILYQQVVLVVEELRIRDILASRFHPHLVFLTNYGIYVCVNSTSEKCSPSAMDPSKLKVKKWCHMDLLDRVYVHNPSKSQYSCYNVVIYLRTPGSSPISPTEEMNSLSLLIQNSELLGCFLYQFSLMCQHKTGKQVSISRD